MAVNVIDMIQPRVSSLVTGHLSTIYFNFAIKFTRRSQISCLSEEPLEIADSVDLSTLHLIVCVYTIIRCYISHGWYISRDVLARMGGSAQKREFICVGQNYCRFSIRKATIDPSNEQYLSSSCKLFSKAYNLC